MSYLFFEFHPFSYPCCSCEHWTVATDHQQCCHSSGSTPTKQCNKDNWDILCQLVHVTGNPWVILGPPEPNPHEIHTHSHGSGFIWVGVWVPVSHHITSSPTWQPHVLLTTTNNDHIRNEHHSRMRGDGLSCPSPIIGIFYYIHIILLY